MKKWCLAFILLGITCGVYATTAQRASELREEQRALAEKIQAHREKMMRENPELKKLQEEKNRINRKMLIIMESDQALFELMQRYADLDEAIQKLPKLDNQEQSNIDSAKQP